MYIIMLFHGSIWIDKYLCYYAGQRLLFMLIYTLVNKVENKKITKIVCLIINFNSYELDKFYYGILVIFNIY